MSHTAHVSTVIANKHLSKIILTGVIFPARQIERYAKLPTLISNPEICMTCWTKIEPTVGLTNDVNPTSFVKLGPITPTLT